MTEDLGLVSSKVLTGHTVVAKGTPGGKFHPFHRYFEGLLCQVLKYC